MGLHISELQQPNLMQITELNAACNEAQGERDSLAEQLADARAATAEASSTANQLQEALAQAARAAEANDAELKAQEDALEAKRAELEAAQAKGAEARATMAALLGLLAAKEAQLAQACAAQQQSAAEVEALRASLVEVQEGRRQLVLVAAMLHKELATYKQVLAAAKQKIEGLKILLRRAAAQGAAQEFVHGIIGNVVETMNARELQAATAASQALEATLGEATTQLEQLGLEKAELKEELGGVKEALRTAKGQANAMRQQQHLAQGQAQERATTAEKRANKAEGDLRSSQQREQGLRQELGAKDKALKEQAIKISRLESQMEGLQADADKWNRAQAQRVEQREAERGERLESEKEKRRLQKQVAQLRGTVGSGDKASQDALDALVAASNKLQKELDAAKARSERLQERIKAAEAAAAAAAAAAEPQPGMHANAVKHAKAQVAARDEQLATLAEEHRQQVEANAAQKRQLEAKEREIEKLLAGGAEAAACKALKKEISQQQGRELALLADMRKLKKDLATRLPQHLLHEAASVVPRVLQHTLTPLQLQLCQACKELSEVRISEEEAEQLQGPWKDMVLSRHQAAAAAAVAAAQQQKQQQQQQQRAAPRMSRDSADGGGADQAPAAAGPAPAKAGRGAGASSGISGVRGAAAAAEVLKQGVDAAVRLALCSLDQEAAEAMGRSGGAAAAVGVGASGSGAAARQ
ncbi:hypothetical protein MNEG_9578 [Monoraphidium neglectum]|uniref:Uncharacterized protein n=1 Tax=Monoraphidium neglectum TaxID=145388 RepID=A0A0D2MVM6_9CHLO|nr:hypothetical protein MNEG_9578 [Monoraphidium neglectum]KIY98385.1 hypothetical protein MNEG_9578 [Monoraphidium neglectum]|eukprot:XP_013897405.1 hypothetical protein MNEG_9578 [Monoraphidium neglectum]